jgi:NAD(P)-dependent dehydrogenase (short-subunit alcohol dehydrogenase family)
MCELFALQCTKTTFPEHRKHFMQSIRTFLTRVRSANLKKIKAYVEKRNPFKRLTNPEDVADVVYLLCKEEAKWITGTIIKVDGGESLQ